MGCSGVVGDDAGELITEGLVEGFGGAAGYCVESDESAVFICCYVFEGGHERAGEAVAAVNGMDEELGNLSAVLLIGGHVENQLD